MNRRDAIKRAALLSGYALTASAMGGILQACKQATPTSDWQPVFFSTEQFASLADMAEAILPRTETPGAKDVGVPQFLDGFAKAVLSEADQQLFRKGIEQANSDCQAIYGQRFETCKDSEIAALLKRYDELAAMDKASSDNPQVIDMGRFFRELKKVTVLAYFTSEEISQKYLHYEPIPGTYAGCIPLSDLEGKTHAITK